MVHIVFTTVFADFAHLRNKFQHHFWKVQELTRKLNRYLFIFFITRLVWIKIDFLKNNLLNNKLKIKIKKWMESTNLVKLKISLVFLGSSFESYAKKISSFGWTRKRRKRIRKYNNKLWTWSEFFFFKVFLIMFFFFTGDDISLSTWNATILGPPAVIQKYIFFP